MVGVYWGLFYNMNVFVMEFFVDELVYEVGIDLFEYCFKFFELWMDKGWVKFLQMFVDCVEWGKFFFVGQGMGFVIVNWGGVGRLFYGIIVVVVVYVEVFNVGEFKIFQFDVGVDVGIVVNFDVFNSQL